MVLQLIFIGLALLSTYTATFYKKGKRVISFSFLLYLFILAAFSYTNNDTGVYRIYWEGSFDEFYTKDVGFGVLFSAAHLFQFSYPVFRFLLYLGCFIILHYVITKINGDDYFLVLILYFMFVFFMDNIEMRNFTGYCVMMLSLFYLIKDNKKDFLKFLLIFAIACTLHKIIIIYLIPCLAYKFFNTNKKNTIFICDVIFIILCVISVNKNLLISALNLLPDFIKEIPGIGRNLVSTNSNGWIINLANTILYYLAGRFMYKQLMFSTNKGIISKDCLQYKIGNLTFVLLVFSAFFVPFYVLSGDYMRITRNIFLLLCCLSYFTFKNYPNKLLTFDRCFPLILLFAINFIEILTIYRGNVQFPWIYDTFINNYFFNFGELKYTFDDRFIWWNKFKS